MNVRRFGRLMTAMTALALLISVLPGTAHAQWPPFNFRMRYAYADGRITYVIRMSGLGTLRLSDVAIKIPLPEGTRYVEGGAVFPGTSVSFDGAEVTCFTPTFHNIQDVKFVVEVTDTARKVFTTHAYIKWSGDQPGDFLTKNVVVDITRPRLEWNEPMPSLSLQLAAVVDGDTVTYSLYLSNDGWLRLWDVGIDLLLARALPVISVQSPTSFTAGVAEGAVSFAGLELAEGALFEPLRVTVSTAGVADAALMSGRAAARWKYEGWGVGTSYPTDGQLATGEAPVSPRLPQLAVADPLGDVPFAYYDLSSIAFMLDGAALKAVFRTVDDFVREGDGDPVGFVLHLDTDCRTDTGEVVNEGIGADYRASYEYTGGDSYFESWDGLTRDWRPLENIKAMQPAGGRQVALWLPVSRLAMGGPLCWMASSQSWNSKHYDPYPSDDEIVSNPDTRLDLTRWQVAAAGTTGQ